MVTYDGGQHWEQQWSTEGLSYYYFPPWIIDVEFVTEDHGYAGLWPLYVDWGPAVVHHTSDGGVTWDSLTTTYAGEVWAEGGWFMLSVVGDTVWINGLSSPVVSTNGGVDWQEIDTYVASLGAVADVMAISGTTFWVSGDTKSGSVVSYTTDMGATWTIILPDYLPRLRAIHVLDQYNIYAVGKEGLILHYSDTIIGTNNGDVLPSGITLHPPYPNPFNPATTIRFELPHTAQVTLTIYDLLGREVATLVEGYTQPGTHEAVWDAGEYPSGIYLARLVTPGYSNTIKLVLLK